MNKFIFLAFLILSACHDNDVVVSPYQMNCTNDLAPKGAFVYRCENKEVVCYIGDNHGTSLQCQYKE